VDLVGGGSLLQRMIHLVSLTQKWWSDIPGLIEGLPWPRTLSGGSVVSSGGS
jgi:hypothetical protein